ncbi:MAG: hypothetical protein P1V97_27875 [Planctomycetota bacterium]|nr:hypothetical protein [Planctomycetota bacterium]
MSDNPDPNSKRDLIDSIKRHALYAAVVLFIMGLTLFFFSPRYAYWPLLYSNAGSLGPEASRAQQILLQLEDPFAKIDDPSNVVIQWRLLFPLIGHYLKLPHTVFFALPFLGCFLSLLLILTNAAKETKSFLEAILITAIAASCSWFFVSTGWLGYFDSYYILGLLLISFYKPRWILLLCCLLLPWVNERFIIGLPLAMTIRAIRFDHLNRENYKTFLTDIALGAIFIGPFLAVRLLATKSNDGISGLIIENFFFANHFKNKPRKMLLGAWFGLRLAWLGVCYYCLTAQANAKAESKAFLFVIVIFSIYAALAISGDTSRTLSLLLPAIVLGLVLFSSQSRLARHWRTITLFALLALNLILPTQHIVLSFNMEIRAFPHEWQVLQKPPLVINPEQNLKLGQNYAKRGQIQEAVKYMSWALRLRPEYSEAYYQRGLLLEKYSRPDLAILDFHQAAQHAPANSDLAKKSQDALIRLQNQ